MQTTGSPGDQTCRSSPSTELNRSYKATTPPPPHTHTPGIVSAGHVQVKPQHGAEHVTHGQTPPPPPPPHTHTWDRLSRSRAGEAPARSRTSHTLSLPPPPHTYTPRIVSAGLLQVKPQHGAEQVTHWVTPPSPTHIHT